MNKIFKYHADQGVLMPKGARILHVGADPLGHLCVWAEVDPTADLVNRKLQVIGTGWDIPHNAGEHIGTATIGDFVWHVFDGGEA